MARPLGTVLSAIALAAFLGGCRLFVTLALSPAALTLAVFEEASLSASWNGVGALIWEASAGEIVPDGLDAAFTAPASAGAVTVTVRSADDPDRSATAQVTVLPTLSLDPTTVTVEVGDALQLDAALLGSSGLRWEASGGSVSGDDGGAIWTAPDLVGSYTVTASSALHPSVRASAAVTVVAAGSGPDLVPPDPPSLDLVAALGEGATGAFTLANDGDAELNVALTPSDGWLAVTPASAAVAPGGSVLVLVDAMCDALGDRSGQIAVASDDGSDGSAAVAVDLACGPRLSAPDPATVALAAEVGEGDSAPFTFDSLAAGATPFALTGAPAWLTVDPSAGSVAAGASRSVTLSTTCGPSASDDQATLTLTSGTPGDLDRSVLVVRSCSEPPPPPPSEFEITLVFSDTITDDQKAVFESAAARWVELIVGDVPDSSLTKGANACGAGDPAFDGPIDDVVIYATVEPIDGPSNILGSAGPCYIRNGSGLTRYGIMRFDSADVGGLGNLFEDVILHEMGHVLGVGTLWGYLGLLDFGGSSCQASSDPTFNGAGAVAAWQALGGSDDVPVEDSGGSGTKCGHWEETVFDNELMTGYLDGGLNPISALTVASLDDLGYTVDPSAADAYTLPACSGNCLRLEGGLDLRGAEEILTPRFALDDVGGVTALE